VNPDDALVNELRRIVAAVDGPPGSVADAAKAAFLFRDIDGELAVLIADSRTDDDFEPIRASAEPGQGSWLHSFEGGGVRIDMEVAGAAGDEYVLETGSGRRTFPVDDLGRFIIEDLGHDRIRLRCRSAGGTSITTAWVTI
jgi:hypothetical protein